MAPALPSSPHSCGSPHAADATQSPPSRCASILSALSSDAQQYVQQKAAASGSSFYYAFSFLPPPGVRPSRPTTPFAAKWTTWSMKSTMPAWRSQTGLVAR